MCKVHTDFNATAAIVGSFGNGTCVMYLHGWDPGGTGNNGWDTVDCAQAIPAALQAYGAVCCGDSSKMLCAPDAGIYPSFERSLGNYLKCDRQLSVEEMLALQSCYTPNARLDGGMPVPPGPLGLISRQQADRACADAPVPV
jgi:hypothetical protein